jgi:N-acetylneuraminate synthase
MEWYPELMKYCEECGIEFMTTCFSAETADHFNELGMKAFKVASSDMSTIPYLKHIARYNKPILLSTGASTMEEIEEAVQAIKEEGNNQIVVMHCTLCYPTMYPDREVHYEDANLSIIQTLKAKFPDLVIGISDHTQTPSSSVIAYAMGADVIEKHYTVDKTLGKSADHWFSVDPEELKEIVDNCKEVQTLKGTAEKKVFDCEKETRLHDKRSIVLKVDVKEGDAITEDMLTYKRPGTGIWPSELDEVIGSTASEDINRDNPLQWQQLKRK